MKKQYLFTLLLTTAALPWHNNAAAAPYIRYEAHTTQGKRAIVSMQKALVKLKALNCNKTVSWYYQSAIHGVPVPGRDAPLTVNPLCPTFTNTTGFQRAWAKCASHNESGPPSDIHFLPWHRLYINHFEKIIRRYSGDSKFALPYWDYEKYPTLPDKFQARAKGSLYESARNPILNNGQPIDSGARNTINGDIDKLQEIADYETYNNQLQKTVHDYVHDYIGGTGTALNKVYNRRVQGGLMGNVPSAAFDPIFWLHHANIDRLWQQWIARNPGQNVTLDQLNSVNWPYVFFKDTGPRVVYTMPQVLSAINAPDFVYDRLVRTKSSAKIAAHRLVPHSLVSTPLNAPVTKNKAAHLALDLPANTTANARTLLQLDVDYAGSPKGRYEVYVNLPDNIAPTNAKASKYFAGAISFFVNDAKHKGGSRQFRYDITNELAAANNAQTLRLTVVKTTGFALDGTATLKKAEILALK